MATEVDEDTIRMAIRRAMYDVKNGGAFVEGHLEEADFDLLQMRDDETITKFFHMVAKRIGKTLPLQKKSKTIRSILEILESQREMWVIEIEEYDGSKEPSAVVNMDVESKEETVSPTHLKAEGTRSDSALVTGDNKSSDTNVKTDPKAGNACMQVDGVTVKVTSQKTELEKESTDMETEEPAQEGALKGDGEAKPNPTGTSADTPDGEKQNIDMDVEESPEAETKAKSEKSRKRKSDAVDGKKSKKPKGSKSRKVEKKKATKKRRRRKTGPTEEQIEATREKMKKEFEEEKARVLADLPEEYKSRWGQCGFAKWGKVWLPCLFVSPYNVGGSELRDKWMQMFENTRDRRHAMTQLVYWYGQENMNVAYSFCTPAQIVSYEKGIEKGHDKMEPKTQRKIDLGKKLTAQESELIKGLDKMKDDLVRIPEERTKFDGFFEDHENDVYIRTFLTGEDSGEELISSDDDDDESLSSDSSSALESESDDDEKKVHSKMKKRTKKPAAKKKPVVAPSMEGEMDFAEDEVSSDDSKDEEAVLSDESDSDNERDADYIVDEPGSKMKAKKTEKAAEKEKNKGSSDRKRSKPPKEGSDSEYARNRKEHRIFRENVETFLPILHKWKSYIEDEDVNKIEEVLQEMLTLVDEMGAPFIEAYKLSPLMQTTKELFRQKNADTATHKKLRKTLRQLHAEKKKLVPPSFKPKIHTPGKRRSKKDKSEMMKKEDRKSKEGASKPKRDKSKSTEPSSLDRNESTNSLPASLTVSQSSATPGTPVRPVLSQGSTSPKTFTSPKSDLPQGGRKATSKKPEKTSFSLSNIINKKPSASQSSDVEASRERQSSQTATVKSLPPWLTSVPRVDIGSLPAEQVDRSLALEFFQGMASCFPEEKVNRESIARSLEAAVYQWSKEQYRKEDTYWPKVHAVVAAVCGKRKPGGLLSAILAGEYDSAMDVVALSDDMLLHSFEGS